MDTERQTSTIYYPVIDLPPLTIGQDLVQWFEGNITEEEYDRIKAMSVEEVLEKLRR